MEIKEFADQFAKTWDAFQKTNNEIIAAKADGKSVSQLEEKLGKLNTKLDEFQSVSDRLVNIETAIKRGGKWDTKDGNFNADQAAHKDAFMWWFRKGDQGLQQQKLDESGLRALQTKALSVNDDTQGGFMVHADLNGRITSKIFETSPMRQYASVTSISTDALEGPLDLNQADFGWVAEAGARPNTNNPKIGMWRIPTHEMYANPAATQKLLDDAAWDPENWLMGKVANRFARAENAAFVNGTGNGQPFGFLQKTVVANATGETTDDFTATKRIGYIATGAAADFPPVPAAGTDPAQGDPLINMVYALKSQYRDQPGTAWAMHRTSFGRVRRLRDNQGQYLWVPGLGTQPTTVLSYPVAEFNDMPLIGAGTFPIAFANWRECYQIVDRIGVRVLRDPYTNKPFVQFYCTKRTGGDVLNYEAIKLLKVAAS